jgi:hypothetical protein
LDGPLARAKRQIVEELRATLECSR